MREIFIDMNFRAERLALIEEVNDVLDRYRSLGYDLTVRQVYYQLVSQDLIPNNPKSYNRIKSLISDGRKAGLIDWDMIVDRTRKTIVPPHWDSPADIIEAAARSFRIDKWENQPNHVEIMVEKEALSGILAPTCEDLDVNFTANKGYSSDSAMYRAGKRIHRKVMQGKVPYILYLGDHDPSGLDMDRDIKGRLEMFGDLDLEVIRLALKMEQVEQMDVPENPAKTSDSRYEAYFVEFGGSSWELDAVEPTELVRLVTEYVESLRHNELWNEKVEWENQCREDLDGFALDYRERNE